MQGGKGSVSSKFHLEFFRNDVGLKKSFQGCVNEEFEQVKFSVLPPCTITSFLVADLVEFLT